MPLFLCLQRKAGLQTEHDIRALDMVLSGYRNNPHGVYLMPRPYYTLVEIGIGYASPEFGDYSRKVVADEMADMKRRTDPRLAKYKIVKSGDTQAEIDDAIAELDY